jgi:hypothetical protein
MVTMSGWSGGIALEAVVKLRHTITVNITQRFIANSHNQ